MRYKLVPMDNDWLKVEPVEDGPFPVKAEGFLVMDAKKNRLTSKCLLKSRMEMC